MLGRRVDFDVLAEVTGTAEDDLIAHLRTLIEAGLLRERDTDVFEFRHDLTREAVEQRLLGRERRRIHELALDLLRSREPIDVSALARHAHAAGHTEEMIDLARQGSADAFAAGSAYRALRLAELGLSEAPTDLALRTTAARAAWFAGLLVDAAAHTERLAADADRVGDVHHRSKARRLLVRLYWELTDDEAMAAVVDDLEHDVEELGDVPAAADALAILAQAAMLSGRSDEAVALADRTIAFAERHGRDDVVRAARVERASALMSHGDQARSVPELLQVAEEAFAHGEDHLGGRAINNAVDNAHGLVGFDERRTLIDRMEEAMVRAGWETPSGCHHLARLELGVEVGDQDEALAWLDQHRCRPNGARVPRSGWLDLWTVQMAMERGDVEAAATARAELTRLGGEMQEYLLASDLGLAALARDGAAARAAYGALIAKRDLDGLDAASFDPILDLIGTPGFGGDQARELAAGIRRARGFTTGGDPLGRDRMVAHAALADGDHRDGVERLDTVLRSPDAPTFRVAPYRASDHLALARGLVQLRRLDEAAEHADRADALLARWPGRRREALDALRRRLGRTGPTERCPAPRRSRLGSARSWASSPRATRTPSWVSACTSRPARPPSTSRTSSPSWACQSRPVAGAWASRHAT